MAERVDFDRIAAGAARRDARVAAARAAGVKFRSISRVIGNATKRSKRDWRRRSGVDEKKKSGVNGRVERFLLGGAASKNE